jgi:hypothetical protein
VSFDLWMWLYLTPLGLMLVVGLVVLARHRRRSRRATGLAIVALAGLGASWLVLIAEVATFRLWGNALPANWIMEIVTSFGLLRQLLEASCILLLVFAVVADRRAGRATGPEADYADDVDPGVAPSRRPSK